MAKVFINPIMSYETWGSYWSKGDNLARLFQRLAKSGSNDDMDAWNDFIRFAPPRLRYVKYARVHLPLRGADLSDCDLTGFDFHGADLRGADLRRIRLFETGFVDCDASGADFRGANLLMAKFSNSRLDGADFRGATGRIHYFGYCSTKGAVFDDDVHDLLPGAYLEGLRQLQQPYINGTMRDEIRRNFGLMSCRLRTPKNL